MARRKTKTVPKVNARFPIKDSNESEFIGAVLRIYQLDVQADEHNMEPARQDIQFVIGDQWDPDTKARRDKLKKPTLTVNRLVAFVAQYIGAWLQNDTTIKIAPSRGGSKQIAEIRQGIVRTITRTGKSKLAISKAMANAYICGVGNFKLGLVDSYNDVFLRDIEFETLPDPFSVIWDRASTEPTGADAQHCFVTQYMTLDDYHEAYPEATGDGGWTANEMDYTTMTGHGWEIDDMIRVCEFWQMRTERITLGLEAETGDVIDVTGFSDEDILKVVAPDDDGKPMVRNTRRKYAECYVMTSNQILEGPYRLDISRLPVFRVEGWSLTEANVKFRWGFVRHAKDPQRLHNYWRSILAEELMKSPSSKWLLDSSAMKSGLAERFRDAHISGDNVLFWDSQSDGAKPEFIPPPMLNQAVLTEAGMTIQDIKDVTNRHEASMGQASGEVSGKAINARQRVAELGDTIYVDNLNMALAQAGMVTNELIPIVYDTNRTVKVTGSDDKEVLQEINGEAGDKTPDVTKGKYDVTYTTGPSYATKRQESVDLMMTLMNTMPQTGTVIADLIVDNMDIPGGDEIVERLQSLLPDGMVDIERLPERRKQVVEQQQKQKAAEMEQQSKMQQAQFELSMAKLEAETMELKARAARSMAQAKRELSEVGVEAAELDIKAAAVQVDAYAAGVKGAALQSTAFQSGLAAAQAETARDDERMAAVEDSEAAVEPTGGESEDA